MEPKPGLTEAAVPYDVRHTAYDIDSAKEQLVENGFYEPDVVFLGSVPEGEWERHLQHTENIAELVETPGTVYFNEDSKENFSAVLDELGGAEQVPISYDAPGSRKADFKALNAEFDQDKIFIGVVQDYSTPRNHRLASSVVDGWNGPRNGFPLKVDGQVFDRGTNLFTYGLDALGSSCFENDRHDIDHGSLTLVEGNHIIVGTTYDEDFGNYRSKFYPGVNTDFFSDLKSSEAVRSYMPQKLKDWMKGTGAVEESEI